MKKSKIITSVLLVLLLAVSLPLNAFAASYLYPSYYIPQGGVRLTAHRGYSAEAPENTLPAFTLAGENGFWGAECDISPTKDGVWVIMHDASVDRTTDGEGLVSDFTYEELMALTIDTGNNIDKYPGTKIPTLIEYLDVCKRYNMHPVIEIKECAPADMMDELAEILLSREEKDMFVIISFGREQIARIKSLMPETPAYLIIGGDTEEAFLEGVDFAVENNLDGIDFACIYSEDIVETVKNAGLKTMIWTVDDKETAENYYRMGVKDVTTNALLPAKEPGKPAIWYDICRVIITLFSSLFGSC